jgi:hypothetical protein
LVELEYPPDAGIGPVASHSNQHERDRVGHLHRGDGVPQRKTMACRGSHRALGRLGLALVAEGQFRKVQGYREIPSLLTSLANAGSKKAVAEEVKVA